MTNSRWPRLSEELLRGLVHAMNNRVTALSAHAELAAMDGLPLEHGVLRQEITRLQGVHSLVGILATRGAEEALELRSVLEAAISIHAHHPRLPAVPCTMEQGGVVLPVRVPRWALMRLFLIMVDEAKRVGAAAGTGAVVVRLSGNEFLSRARIIAPDLFGDDAAELAALCGGTLVQHDGETALELPSLLELRRRERAAS